MRLFLAAMMVSGLAFGAKYNCAVGKIDSAGKFKTVGTFAIDTSSDKPQFVKLKGDLYGACTGQKESGSESLMCMHLEAKTTVNVSLTNNKNKIYGVSMVDSGAKILYGQTLIGGAKYANYCMAK